MAVLNGAGFGSVGWCRDGLARQVCDFLVVHPRDGPHFHDVSGILLPFELFEDLGRCRIPGREHLAVAGCERGIEPAGYRPG